MPSTETTNLTPKLRARRKRSRSTDLYRLAVGLVRLLIVARVLFTADSEFTVSANGHLNMSTILQRDTQKLDGDRRFTFRLGGR